MAWNFIKKKLFYNKKTLQKKLLRNYMNKKKVLKKWKLKKKYKNIKNNLLIRLKKT
jgi:hypothetical protein